MTTTPPPRAWSRRTGFALVGATLLLFMLASAAPSPLYPLWAAEWGMSPPALTAVFATYALALLVTLAVAGRLSDHLGRRSVLLGGVVLEVGSLLAFAVASDAVWLLAARALQGVATGLVSTAAGAALLDLAPPRRPGAAALLNGLSMTGGLGVGVAAAGVVVHVVVGADAASRDVFGALAVLVALTGLALLRLPAGGGNGTGRAVAWRAALVSLRPQWGLPRHLRAVYATSALALLATWGVGALWFSLGSSVTSRLIGLSPLAGALVIALLPLAGAVTSMITSRISTPRLLLHGALALLAGLAVQAAAVAQAGPRLLVVGAVVGGVGWSGVYTAALRAVVSRTAPHERGGVMTAVYLVSYLSLSLPALASGAMVPVVGLRDVVLGYYAVIAVPAVGVAVVALRASRADRRCVVVPVGGNTLGA